MMMMSPIRETQKKYCSRAMIFAVIIGILFYVIGFTDLMKGLILGTFFSIINFVLMGETLPQRLNKSKKRIFWIAFGSVTLRYIFLAVPMVLALKSETYNLYATVAGIFMVQIQILLDQTGVKFVQKLIRK